MSEKDAEHRSATAKARAHLRTEKQANKHKNNNNQNTKANNKTKNNLNSLSNRPAPALHPSSLAPWASCAELPLHIDCRTLDCHLPRPVQPWTVEQHAIRNGIFRDRSVQAGFHGLQRHRAPCLFAIASGFIMTNDGHESATPALQVLFFVGPLL